MNFYRFETQQNGSRNLAANDNFFSKPTSDEVKVWEARLLQPKFTQEWLHDKYVGRRQCWNSAGGEDRMWRRYSELWLEADEFDFQKWIHEENHNHPRAAKVLCDNYHPWYSNKTADDKAPESVRRSQAYKEWKRNQRQHLRHLTLKAGILSV